MNKDNIAREIRDLFFSPILAKALAESFDNSGLDTIESFTHEMISNEVFNSKFKARLAVDISAKYTELGLPTTPDDIEVIINETGIEVVNFKIRPDRKGNHEDSSSNLE